MIDSESTIETVEKNEAIKRSEKNFKNVKDAIRGLYEILSLNFSENESNIYFEMGQENLTGLYQNLLEIFLNDKGLEEFAKKVRNSEIELDVTLREF